MSITFELSKFFLYKSGVVCIQLKSFIMTVVGYTEFYFF